MLNLVNHMHPNSPYYEPDEVERWLLGEEVNPEVEKEYEKILGGANTVDNLEIYNKVRKVPDNAIKPINAGRLRGKSDINPMWRLKTLTETFGVCGIGWRYEITKQWLEEGGNDEKAAFVNINLYIKRGEWSEAIPGTGGSMFVAKEKNGPYTSDECFKMALTDAISVACKSLGVGADVYWSADSTKYTTDSKPNSKPEGDYKRITNDKSKPSENKNIGKYQKITTAQAKTLFRAAKENKDKVKTVLNKYGYKSSIDISVHDYAAILGEVSK